MGGSGVIVHIRTNATRSNQAGWGDTQYAEGLARAIRQHPGCEARLLFRGEMPEVDCGNTVLLQIVGPHLEEPVPGAVNLLWIISPPSIAPAGMLGRYQGLFVASHRIARRLQDLGLAADYLPQATEARHFHPARRPEGEKDIPLVFVGAYAARVDRRLVLQAVEAGFEPQIWGPGWKDVIPDRLWRGERLGYDELAQTYARARIVLNSHMHDMARLGFMSNRSYDAMASGARVVSDLVTGFEAPDLPELEQVQGSDALAARLGNLLAMPAPDMAQRVVLHERLARAHGFDARAAVILERARDLLGQGWIAPAPFARRPGTGLHPPRLTDPAASAADGRDVLLAASAEILTIARHLEQDSPAPLAPPDPAEIQGVIHLLMAPLREIQQIALSGTVQGHEERIGQLVAAARRVREVLREPVPLQGISLTSSRQDRYLVNILHNRPLWPHAPSGFHRDPGKASVPLWPRRQLPRPQREIGVFLHLYHDDLASALAGRMAQIAVPHRIHVSTDTEAKAARIRASLPDAQVRVLENRGRDIWPKLYGLADAYADHDVVLHLHGKKSPHHDKLDGWLIHILDCLTGTTDEVNRILSFFETIPRLGMVVPVPYRKVLDAAHWGANRDIAQELAWRMGLEGPLPDDGQLRFPVGSMFWARTAAIRPLLDLDLKPGHFPPESGQVDGTLAHAIERMLGVVCRATGHHILPVSGSRARVHAKYRRHYHTNGELRAALENGVFDV